MKSGQKQNKDNEQKKSEVYDEQEKLEKMDSAVEVFSNDDVSVAIEGIENQQP
ncbi:hypothetical protein F511_46710 [Dorcoceras hygrometricum]|uniref:Uncharacterized protein n=1 Tax=Dorcoceras hygrometricum TaxID=472368 RepID=A0A2Z6ZSV0_9LAMI|nr:hypothetical protein F511_46710 [Dorcoceras hygrometricum]